MLWYQTITDAKGRWAVIVDYEPNIIGHEYTFNPRSGKVIKESYDQTDLHYGKRDPKPPIPEGPELKVDCWWRNFYGSYFRVKYNGNCYDVKSSNIELEESNK